MTSRRKKSAVTFPDLTCRSVRKRQSVIRGLNVILGMASYKMGGRLSLTIERCHYGSVLMYWSTPWLVKSKVLVQFLPDRIYIPFQHALLVFAQPSIPGGG